VPPNGVARARSTSTWIHWWSPVTSANVSMSAWVTSCQPLVPSFDLFARLMEEGGVRAEALVLPLSPREREILALLGTGASNKEIADRLCLAEGTVKNHVTNILTKLDVRDRTQAALRARQLGLT